MNAITPSATEDRIRNLNDAFRSSFVGGVVTLTDGVNSLHAEVKEEVLKRVREFNRFTQDNDPHGEHDFGSFEIVGKSFMWKIDYYDKNVEFGSEDPADAARTTRVLTIMLAEEY
jgi:hypothetical protein